MVCFVISKRKIKRTDRHKDIMKFSDSKKVNVTTKTTPQNISKGKEIPKVYRIPHSKEEQVILKTFHISRIAVIDGIKKTQSSKKKCLGRF